VPIVRIDQIVAEAVKGANMMEKVLEQFDKARLVEITKNLADVS